MITIAARIHVAYNGKENVSFNASAGEEWYAPYVRYAESVGILSKDLFAGQYERCATRYEVVKILSSTLPGSELSNQNPYRSEIADMKPTRHWLCHYIKGRKIRYHHRQNGRRGLLSKRPDYPGGNINNPYAHYRPQQAYFRGKKHLSPVARRAGI